MVSYLAYFLLAAGPD